MCNLTCRTCKGGTKMSFKGKIEEMKQNSAKKKEKKEKEKAEKKEKA